MRTQNGLDPGPRLYPPSAEEIEEAKAMTEQTRAQHGESFGLPDCKDSEHSDAPHTQRDAT